MKAKAKVVRKKRKNPAAVALGSRSWKGLTKAERSARARESREKQLAGLSAAERSERMRELIRRRWQRPRDKQRTSA